MNIKPLSTNSNPVQSHTNLHTPKYQNPETRDGVNNSSTAPASNNSIQAPSVHEARKLLNDKIITALDKTLTQSNQTSLYELDPADYTPEKVADRILSFVGAAFASLDSGDKDGQSEKLEQARAGIEKGFNDAKEILEGLGAFNGKIADNANKTYDLLQTGLERISANIESGGSVLEGLFQKDKADLSTESSLETSSFLKRSFDLELTTQDGDKVTININKLDASQDSAFNTESADGRTTTLSSSRLTESGYSISVNGNLDEEEVQAIDKLLAKMTDISDKYFSGDTQAALDKVSQLGYNTSEIASFSLDLKEVQQTKATAIYQQTEGVANTSQLGQLIKPLQEYAAQVSEGHNQYMENKLFSSDGDQFQQLLNNVTDANHIFPDKNKMNQFESFNSSLLALLQ